MDRRLHRRALLLSYFTVAYNIVEGVVSIVAGVLAGSVALVGFGLDSFVESLSGWVMLWRFGRHGGGTEEERQCVERRAVRLVAWTFFILAAYVLYESAHKLYTHDRPSPTLLGIAIAVVSLVVMPALAWAKHRTGEAIASPSLMADARETVACAWLSLALLIGLGLNNLYGLWWADPVAGLAIVAFLVREGWEAWSWEEEAAHPDDT